MILRERQHVARTNQARWQTLRAHSAKPVQLTGAFEWEGAQQDPIDHAENRRARPDAERQGNNRCGREPRTPREHPGRITDVLKHHFEPAKRPHVPQYLLGRSWIAKLQTREPFGFFWFHARLAVPACQGGEMELQFVLKIAIQLPSLQERADAKPECG